MGVSVRVRPGAPNTRELKPSCDKYVMILIEEYVLRDKNERMAHLRLNEACIEIGGHSTQFRGLLAYTLGTTLPKGSKIHLCHACHNDNCSNPLHLYWGTSQENRLDAVANGSPTAWDSMVRKYGEDVARNMQRNRNHSQAGKGNTGKPKSEAHKEAIRQAILRKKVGNV